MSKDIDNLSGELENINLNSLYFYWSDKIEINKLITIKNELNYLPVYPYSSIEYDKLINSDVLIFFKNPKIIYGYFKIKTVILKNKKIKNYFETDESDLSDISLTNVDIGLNTDINNNDQIYSNTNIIINEKLFEDLIKKYKINYVPNLFFMQIIEFKIFKYEISIKGLNDYFLNLESDYIKLKYPSKVKDIHIVKNDNLNIIKNINKYIKFIENKVEQTNLNTNNISSTKSTNIEESNSEKDIKKKFNIPVLWKICDELSISINNNVIKKNILINHWENCSLCEKTDNNYNEYILGTKKIKFSVIDDKNIISNIIESYQNVKKYQMEQINFNLDLISNDKTNIIYSPDSKNIYSKCLFIIE